MDFPAEDTPVNIEPVYIETQQHGLAGGATSTRPETLKPVKTRATISIFEYTAVITSLAKYLASLPDIGKFLDKPYVNSLINPSELAFNLLEAGKMDAVIDRGYERVSYSQLAVNEKWKNMLRDYFAEKRTSIREELITPFEL